jgi:4-amino-4-deoxy-L-arabinose transferase-like glycosyltransferase
VGYLLILTSVNLLFLALRYLYILFYPIDLAPDEALYWEYSRRPDISYYSKPPLVGYLIALSTAFLGNTEIGVRFFPPLFAFVLSFVVYRFTLELYRDPKKALMASLLPHFLIGPSMNAILMTIDAPFIFFYSLSLWLLWKAMTTASRLWWISAGISSALALLSKYTAVFLIPTLLLFKPRLLRVREFWMFTALLFLAFVPLVLWNAMNDFVGFKHLFFLAGAKDSNKGFTIAHFLEFLGGQLAILSVIPFFFMAYGWYRSIRNGKRQDQFLTAATLPVVLFFALLSLKTEVYANWSAFPYMAGIILAVRFMDQRWFKRSVILGLALLIPLYTYLPPKIDIKKRIVGWEELGKEVGSLYEPEKDFIFSPTYQLSAELAFYVKGNPKTYSVNLGRRMNDYDLWKEDLPLQRGKNGIFVTPGGLDPRVRRAFAEVLLEREFVYTYRGAVVRKLKIYKLKGFKGHIEEVKPESY